MTETITAPEQLSTASYARVFSALEHCSSARDVQAFRVRVAEALTGIFDHRHIALFMGPTFGEMFDDPEPFLRGPSTRLVDPYRERWTGHDVNASPQAADLLRRNNAFLVSDLSRLVGQHRRYMEDFMWPNRLRAHMTMLFDVPGGHCIVGIYHASADRFGTDDLGAMRLLGRHLGTVSRGLPALDSGGSLSALSPRLRQVAELIGDGLSNDEIARTLGLSADTVKKHVSRTLRTAGVRNRTELAVRCRSAASS
jgi:DNA-binding CsgD family transcriptional regulator